VVRRDPFRASGPTLPPRPAQRLMDHGRPTSAGHAAMPVGAKDLADLLGQPVGRRAAENCAVGATT
jgi:hypothetical protein